MQRSAQSTWVMPRKKRLGKAIQAKSISCKGPAQAKVRAGHVSDAAQNW
jgi:hypothetical protein